MIRRALAPIVALVILVGCNQDVEAPQKGTDTVSAHILGGYGLTLPSTYKVTSGSGIDTWVFHAYRDDGKVTFDLEVGSGTPVPRKRFTQLPETLDPYTNRIEFTAEGVTGVYFFKVLEARMFRGIAGMVIWGEGTGGGYEEVFDTSHSANSLAEVLQILSTLKHE